MGPDAIEGATPEATAVVPPPVQRDTPSRQDSSLEQEESRTSEREVSRKTKIREIGTVGSRSVYREMRQAAQEVEGLTEQERINLLETDKGKNLLFGMWQIETLSDGTHTGEALTFKSSDPLKYTKDGKVMTVKSLEVTADGKFSCFLQDPENENVQVPETLTREQIQQSILTSNPDAASVIMARMPPGQRELLQLHIDVLQGGEQALEGKDSNNINALSKKAADETEIITTEDMRGFAERTIEDPAQKQEFLDSLAGRNLLDPETAAKIMQNLDLDTLSTRASSRVQEIQKSLNSGNLDGETRKQLERELALEREYVSFYEKASDYLRQDQGMQIYLEKVRTAQVDTKTAREVKNALKSGNLETAVNAIFHELQDDPKDSPEQKAEKKLKREAAIKKAKTIGGIGLLGLLFLLMAVADMGMDMASQK